MSSEMLDALAMALDPERTKSKIAGCTSCKAPLIGTMKYPGAEFYCLECGKHLSYVSPTPLESTPENNERLAKLEAEWKEHRDDEAWLAERCSR
jgi:predicted RNA-binding Zn-ribbon protein involved in translation (DUF1610 family)